MVAVVMHSKILCLPVTPGEDCSLIKAVPKIKEFFNAASKRRSGKKTQPRDEGWEKGSCHGMSQLTEP